MNNESLGKLILRLVLGFTILLHGIAKLRGGVAPIEGLLQSHGLPAFIAYGAYLGEVLGPIMVIVGWHARIGAGLIAANMLVAVSLAHVAQLFTLNEQGGWALELQAMYLFSAIAIALFGPGRFSVNQK
jgi:putative oxidoreductase